MKEETYIDKVSGETLYIQKTSLETFYFKDKEKKILHRVDGPAKDYEHGTGVWFQNNQRHRVDGPAIEWDNGSKEWWVANTRLAYMRGREFSGPQLLQNRLDSIKNK